MQQDLLVLIQSWQEQVNSWSWIDLIMFCQLLCVPLQSVGGEKLRLLRLLIAKRVQKAIAIGAPPETIQYFKRLYLNQPPTRADLGHVAHGRLQPIL